MGYAAGQIVEGKITGIQPYGAFVALDPETSGLIHISEISDGYVKDVGRFVQIGESVRVKILEFDEKAGQAKLSLKAVRRSHTRYRRRQPSCKATLPVGRIGFASIREKLDGWIEDAFAKLKDE